MLSASENSLLHSERRQLFSINCFVPGVHASAGERARACGVAGALTKNFCLVPASIKVSQSCKL